MSPATQVLLHLIFFVKIVVKHTFRNRLIVVILFFVVQMITICWVNSVKQVHWGATIVHLLLAFGGAFSLPLRDLNNPAAVWRKIFFAICVVVFRAYFWWISESQTSWMQRVFNELYFEKERVYNELYFLILIVYLPNCDVGPYLQIQNCDVEPYLQICLNWDKSDKRTGPCSRDEEDTGKCADCGKGFYDQCSKDCSWLIQNLRCCGLACMGQFEWLAKCALHARRILFEVYEIPKPQP